MKNLYYVASDAPRRAAKVHSLFYGVKGPLDIRVVGHRLTKDGISVPEFLINGRTLTAEEVAAEAAKAVAEAELATAAAEAAARDAEAAEQEALDAERQASAMIIAM